jgi:hypothetical protein
MNLQGGRAEQDDEEGREDAAGHREEHLQGGLLAGLLGPLAAAAPDLLGLDAQHVGDPDTPSCSDWMIAWMKLFSSSTLLRLAMSSMRLEAGATQADLVEHLVELGGQGIAVLVADATERRVEAEAGLDADGEQVECGGQREQDLLLPAANPAGEDGVREQVADDKAGGRTDEQLGHAASWSRAARASPKKPRRMTEMIRSTRKPPTVSPQGRPARLSFSWRAWVRCWLLRAARRRPQRSRVGRRTRSKKGRVISTSARLWTARPGLGELGQPRFEEVCLRRAGLVQPEHQQDEGAGCERGGEVGDHTWILTIFWMIAVPTRMLRAPTPSITQPRVWLNHRREVRGLHEEEEEGQTDRQQGDDHARHPRLRGDGPDLPWMRTRSRMV